MKKGIFVMASFVVAINLFAAKDVPNVSNRITTRFADVKTTAPAAVLASFQSIFGNAPVRQWKLRKDGNWRAHFLKAGVAWEATFTPAGVLVKSEPDSNG